MIIQQNLNLCTINETLSYRETEFQNRDGYRITVPARSIMWTDYNNDDGYPVYEFASLDFVHLEQNEDGTYNLVATEALEERIRNRRQVKTDITSRVFHMVIKRRDSVTGEIFDYPFDEKSITDKLDSTKVRYHYGIATHNCDTYSEDDEKEEIQLLTRRYRSSGSTDEGGLEDYLRLHRKIFKHNQKPQHIHCLIRNEKVDGEGRHMNMRLDSLAKKLGYPVTCFQKKYDNSSKGGSDGFIDGIRYLTHETEEAIEDGKYQYPDSVRTVNFDWKAEYEKVIADREKYGNHNVTPKMELRYKVMYEGMTLKQAENYDEVLYLEDFEKLQKCRGDYLKKRAPLPALRINIYIDGPGGIGKNVAGKALAKALHPELSEDECYFEVGGNNVSFDGYDGQPVIIWNDVRAVDLIMKFGRGEVFDIFDSHPTNTNHNVKYGSVRLVNTFNIVNGVQPYDEFLNSLAGEYEDKYGNYNVAEDKGQTYRRFPIILCLREKDFDVLLNRGVAEGTREYDQYIANKGIQGSFGELAKRLSGKAKEVVLINMLQPALEATEKIKQIDDNQISDISAIPSEFLEYGKESPEIPEEEEQKNLDEINEEKLQKELKEKEERLRISREIWNRHHDPYGSPLYTRYVTPDHEDGIKKYYYIDNRWWYAIASEDCEEDHIRWGDIPLEDKERASVCGKYNGAIITDKLIETSFVNRDFSDDEIFIEDLSID